MFLKNGNLIINNAEDVIEICEGVDNTLLILEYFKFPTTKNDMFSILNKKRYVSEKEFEELFNFFIDYNLIKEYTNIFEQDIISNSYYVNKFQRQISSLSSIKDSNISLALHIQDSIMDKKVVLLGVGGTGSYLALSLVMMGIKELVIIDFDEVELSNTTRQVLYNEEDVDKLKILVAKDKLEKYRNDIVIHTFNKQIKNMEDLEKIIIEHTYSSIIACNADTPRGKIQYIVDEISLKYNIPWVANAPYNHDKIFVGPLFIPKVTKSYIDMFPKNTFDSDHRIDNINDNFVASICDPFNGLSSKILSVELLKYFTNYSECSIIGKRINLDTKNWMISIYE